MNSTRTPNSPIWLSVKATAATKQWSLGSLKYQLFNREINCLAQHIRKIGARIYINQNGFDQWIEESGVENPRRSV